MCEPKNSEKISTYLSKKKWFRAIAGSETSSHRGHGVVTFKALVLLVRDPGSDYRR